MSDAEEMELNFQVPLGGGLIDLEPRQALELRSMLQHPGYVVLRAILQGMNEADKSLLQSVELDLDALRVAQGKVLAIAELAAILEHGLKEWYEMGQSKKRNAEETA